MNFIKRKRSKDVSENLSIAETTGRISTKNQGFLQMFRRHSDSLMNQNLTPSSPSTTCESFHFMSRNSGLDPSSTYRNFDEIALEPLTPNPTTSRRQVCPSFSETSDLDSKHQQMCPSQKNKATDLESYPRRICPSSGAIAKLELNQKRMCPSLAETKDMDSNPRRICPTTGATAEFELNSRRKCPTTGAIGDIELNQRRICPTTGAIGDFELNQRRRMCPSFNDTPGFDSQTSLLSSSGTQVSDDTFCPSSNSQKPYELTPWPPLCRKAPSRDVTIGRLGFLLSILTFTLNLRNFIEFPLLVLQGGGLVFLLIYIFLLLFAALPLIALLASLGQYVQQGFLSSWRMARILNGLGGVLLSSSMIQIVYSSRITSLSLLYFLGSFLSNVPWTLCDGAWNSINDCQYFDSAQSVSVNGNSTEFCSSEHQDFKCTTSVIRSTALLFWDKFIVGNSNDNITLHRWELLACLAVVWTIIFIVTAQGFRTVSRIIIFIVLLALAALLALLIRINLMPEALQGNIEALTPSWTYLANARIWYAAGKFVSNSFFPTFGFYIVLGSRNSFLFSNVLLESSLAVLLSGIITIGSSTLVFASLGMNGTLNAFKDVDYITFAYVVPAETFRGASLAKLWSIAFYGLIALLSLGTLLCIVESLATTLEDRLPVVKRIFWILFLCLFSFLLSLPLISNKGHYISSCIDYYFKGFLQFFIASSILITTVWIYGFSNIVRCIEFMTYPRFVVYFFYPSWSVLCPLLFITCGILNIVFMDGRPFRDSPIDIIALCILIIILLQIPIYIMIQILKILFTRKGSIHQLLTPVSNWGPHIVPHIVVQHSSLFDKRNSAFRDPSIFYY